MTTQFGTAKPPAAKPAGARYLTLKDLPEKGIKPSSPHVERRAVSATDPFVTTQVGVGRRNN